MSVQFGRWSFAGEPLESKQLSTVRAMLTPYGPDGVQSYANDGVVILNFALHTSKESRRENQPYISLSGSVFTWDGRLDNRAELVNQIDKSLPADAADVQIVAASFEKWHVDCLAKLLGDWALTIWNPRERTLLLAKDFLGGRHLYYLLDPGFVMWSSILDPLVLWPGKTLKLEEEYLAGWLARLPAPHLTPYVGIHSVLPTSYVLLSPSKTVRQYWRFDPGKRIRYQTDTEYENNFRAIFAESVRRRLRADAPVLAELSGGMDSSSIVCVADDLVRDGFAGLPRLDTVSYYDDSEPNWNEKPSLAEVEKRRGRIGCHIEAQSESCFTFPVDIDYFAATPGAIGSDNSAANEFATLLASSGYRVVLSGLGGDETTGGVPTPLPELCDLLSHGKILRLAHQLKLWALSKRRPWFNLLAETVGEFLPLSFTHTFGNSEFTWLDSRFCKRNHHVLHGYETRMTLTGPSPSFQENLAALNSLRRQLATFAPAQRPPYEKRYPFLDRDLLEFLYAVPRDQLVRPGERRSLLRRALRGTVPDAILNRKRKAFVNRGLMNALSAQRRSFGEPSSPLACERLGILNRKIFLGLLQRASEGQEVPGVPLLRVLNMESWLRHLENRRVLDLGLGRSQPQRPSLANARTNMEVRT
jgi:asparagine synthase (glutamine-hydrolysing)